MAEWLQDLEDARQEIHLVDLAGTLTSKRAWRTFMEHHVFAVWDFMSLLKKLQRELTCMQLPWTPPVDAEASRLINEMVLAEESDEDGEGGYISHFNLYRRAMAEAGAQTDTIDTVCAKVSAGVDWQRALDEASLPAPLRSFLQTTLTLATTGSVHEVAAAFLFGREALLPNLFRELLAQMSRDHSEFKALHYYLSRHIELDEVTHAPMAHRLLERLCAGEPQKQAQAQQAAMAALQARRLLWRSIADAVSP